MEEDIHLETIDLPHKPEGHVGDLLGVLLAIGVGKAAGNQIAVTDYLHFVDVKHVNSVVEYVVKVVEKLDSLAGGAHRRQLGKAHDISEEEGGGII